MGAPVELNRHRFGANYVPSQDWYYSWNNFDADSVARDFDALAALGLDHIRLMTIWPWFHPNPDWVSSAHLDRLAVTMDLARGRGLDVMVTAFTGWLCGYSFEPNFVPRDQFYTHQWDVQDHYLTRLAGTVADRTNFLGFDLGNELNCQWQAPDTATGDAWMRQARHRCHELAPGRVHVNGVDHQPWFEPRTFSARALAREQPIVPLHAWILFTGAMERGGPESLVCRGLLASMARLARAWAGQADKPIWIQEFGASYDWMPEADKADFLTESVTHGISEGVAWFTWWCSHDIHPRLRFPSLEYDMGLLDTDNRPKPHALAFRDLARTFSGRRVTIPDRPLIAPPPSETEATWRWLLDTQAD